LYPIAYRNEILEKKERGKKYIQAFGHRDNICVEHAQRVPKIAKHHILVCFSFYPLLFVSFRPPFVFSFWLEKK